MDNIEPVGNSKSLINNKKLLFAILGVLLVIIVVAILIVVLGRRDTNVTPTDSSKNNQNTTVQQPQQENPTLLPNNVCPESLTFTPSLLAKLNGKNYLVSGEALSWIESNCPNTVNESKGTPENSNTLSWTFNGTNWVSNGNVPSCSNPLEIMTPVDMTLVSGMLYPGQVRGTDYKPHGGFAFDNNSDNQVTVKLPDDAVLWRAARYIEGSDTQYILDFITDCGIAYRFDHLLTLNPQIEQIMDTLPQATESTQTHLINPPTEFKKGFIIATEVGFRNPLNVSFDFGVYDLRQRNSISQNDADWATQHKDEAEYAFYGICWLDNLAGQDKVIARSLNARGKFGDEGKESDYCN